ncbi:MAG: hypothetical protein PUD55_05520 [Firmicutes bacterium]|nr:hypothetical protein [Bacillota bacterium]
MQRRIKYNELNGALVGLASACEGLYMIGYAQKVEVVEAIISKINR